MKIYRYAVLPMALKVALFFSGISGNAIAASTCGPTISQNRTTPCYLSNNENLTIDKGVSIIVPTEGFMASQYDKYSGKTSAVNVGNEDIKDPLITVHNIENNGILKGTNGLVVTPSGLVEKLVNRGTISTISGGPALSGVTVAGTLKTLENYGSIIDPAGAGGSIFIIPELVIKNPHYGKIDTIQNQKGGSIQGIIMNGGTLTNLNNYGILSQSSSSNFLPPGALTAAYGADVGIFNNYGTVAVSNKGIIVSQGSTLKGLNNQVGSKGIIAGVNAIEVTGQGPASDSKKIQPSRIKKITNASTIYGNTKGIYVDDKGVIETITNTDTGVIKGIIFSIHNKGTITNGIDNAGTIDGNVELGSARLYLSGPKAILKGDVSGTKDSIVTIGNMNRTDKAKNLDFTYTHNMNVGTVKISSGNKLRLGDGHTTGKISGNIVNDGEFYFNRSDKVIYGHNISGAGSVHQVGSGTTIFQRANNYAGATTVQQGTLLQGAEKSFSPLSSYTIGQRGTLDMGGFNTTIPALNNSGRVVMGGDSNAVGSMLTITGDYRSNNGTVSLSTVLGDDSSKTDRLVVNGKTSGTTHLVIKNVGGKGAKTNEGIKVVDMKGAAGGNFSLAGDYSHKGNPTLVTGAHAYRLYKNSADNSLYLRSSSDNSKPTYQAGVSVYESYGRMLQIMNAPESLRDRTGGRKDRVLGTGEFRSSAAEDSTDDSTSQMPTGVWGRITASYGKLSPRVSTSDANATTYNMVRAQIGMDKRFYENNQGSVTGGGFLQYSKIDADVGSPHGDGNIRANGYTFGATSTWYGKNKFYVDGLAQMTYFDNDLHSKTAGRALGNSKSALGYALGLEAGQEIGLNQKWSMTPQAQLVYSSINMNGFHDPFGAKIRFDRSQSLKLRVGTTIDYRQKATRLYGFFNINQEVLGRNDSAKVADVAFISGNDRTWGDGGAGGSYSWDNGKSFVYAQASASTSLNNFADSYDLKGQVGLRTTW
ncbi:putative Outer membrane autotransporter [Xenorhabdus bovienii str. Jollieti]|uniref:Putative Outer membrane autotransporter n=1 Tax=Xenorhabdus bovienii (strain SS-2004) TaxID=406818 RepID=D3UYI5_XENBS|nr:autotransporter outer membrane beta-barrel domain-containing protein [Xenorhabdus bovienii]CBJ79363.1 putative Outer membrane autotransporter [Xenorhabdus bovienii SS-2004]CDH30206.1 putative Outer membrane autotransporter [Xenorhabdus bovienii str. Jollieti]